MKLIAHGGLGMDPKEIVADIRRKLLVDVEVPPELRQGVDELKEQLNNALDHLSRDLYSTDTHFVLELIQNADDNKYADGVEPFLKFVVDDKYVQLENNELGFSPDNVRSLCRVGASTKSKRDGFIGEKGLGFKSVFKVTDEPHVFSNGFSFKFKLEQSKDGYVVPHWVEDAPVEYRRDLTTFYLPLRDEIEVAPYFEAITATLILFLRRLQKLEIYIPGRAGLREISKLQQNGITILLDSNTTEPSRYLVTSRSVVVPGDLGEQSRAGITQREIVMAFQLDPAGTAKAAEQTLFAFLPVRTYGFKFIVQGDFLLAANREDVRRDSQWNEWLRSEIAQTFCESLEHFKGHQGLRNSYLHYVPLPDEIGDSFFAEVVPQIHNQLSASACLLSVSGKWSLPSKLLRSSASIRKIIPNEELKRITDFEYLVPEQEVAPSTVLDAIGCKVMLLNQVHTCLADDSWFQLRSLSWYRLLFSWLANHYKQNSQIEQLRKYKILPLAGGGTARAGDGQVFFSAELKFEYGFESSLRMLNPDLFKGLEKDKAADIRAFLEKLGIKTPSAYQVIDACILPLYQSGEFAKVSKAELRDHIRYIKQHLSEYRKACTAAKESLATKLGVLRLEVGSPGGAPPSFKAASELYLPATYKPAINAAGIFAGVPSVAFVSSAYRKSRSVPAEEAASLESWRSFLLEIGVNEYPRIVPSKEFGQIYAPVTERIGHQAEDWNLADEVSAALRNPITRAKVVEAIDRGWNSVYAAKRRVIIGSHYRNPWQESQEPNFVTQLKSTLFETSLGTMLPPSECLLNTATLRNSFGSELPFVSLDLRCPEFISALGISHELDLEFALGQLRRMRDRSTGDIALATKLYGVVRLTAGACMEKVRKTFREERLILVSAGKSIFASSDEVCWSSYPAPLDKRKSSIERLYPELRSFFIESIGVLRELNALDLAAAVEEISDNDEVTDEESELVIAIYHELSKWIDRKMNEGSTVEPWFDEFIKKGVFLTARGFEFNVSDIFVNDDPELCLHFENTEAIAFLRVPASHNSRLESFIRTSGLQFASEAVVVRPCTSEAELDRGWTLLLRKAIPHIARYLHAKRYQDFKELAESGTFAQLSKFECLVVEPLTVDYELGGARVFARRKVLLDGNSLLVDRELANSDMIAAEFSHLFGTSDGVSMFIPLLLDKLEANRPIEFLFNSAKIPPLSEADLAFLASALAGSEIEWTGEIKLTPDVARSASPNSDDVDKSAEVKHDASEPSGSRVESPVEMHAPAEVPPAAPTARDDADKSAEVKQNAPTLTDSHVRRPGEIPVPTGVPPDTSTANKRAAQSDEVKQGASVPGGENKHIEKATDLNLNGGSQSGPMATAGGSWIRVCAPGEASGGTTREFSPRIITARKRVVDPIAQAHRSGTNDSNDGPGDYTAIVGRDAQEIGAWGEEWMVEKYLPGVLQQEFEGSIIRQSATGFDVLKHGLVLARVTWMNFASEQYLPYDVTIKRESRSDLLFVEVKSTCHAERDWFDISRNEWDLAGSERGNYCIYRVYGCGSASPEVMVIDDPYGRWQERELEANPVRLLL